MNTWQKYDQDETVYDGHRKVVLKHYKNAEGKSFDFETFEKVGSESVVVLALDKEGSAIVAEQYRVGPEMVMLDCPGGGVGKNQTPEEAARAELLEEAGYESSQWQYLGSTHEHPYSNRNRHYFLALDAEKIAEPSIDDLEDIEVKKISIDQLITNARTGKMTDALIVFYAYDALRKFQKERTDETTN